MNSLVNSKTKIIRAPDSQKKNSLAARKSNLLRKGKKIQNVKKSIQKHIEIFASVNQPDTLATFLPIDFFAVAV